MSDETSYELLELPDIEWDVAFLLLVLREQGSYEDELARRMGGFGLEAVDPEVVYLSLRRMKEEGMVVAESDQVDGGPPRLKYSITESGEAYLECWANSLTRYQEEVKLFFELYGHEVVRR